MKSQVLSFIFLFSFSILAAQPEGRLYVQQLADTLSYIAYPAETQHFVDKAATGDLAVIDANLFATERLSPISPPAWGSVFAYDLNNNHQKSTVIGDSVKALFVETWQKKLIIGSTQAPYLRVFDPTQNYQETFNLIDRSTIPSRLIDLLVSDSRAYMLIDHAVVVVDLDIRDTLAVVELSYPYPVKGQDLQLVDMGDYIYIFTDYPTGAPRSSLLKIEKTSLQAGVAFHKEFAVHPWNFPLVATDNKIYVYNFDSHYDRIADSLVFFNGTSLQVRHPLLYESKSQNLFLFSGVTQADGIEYMSNNGSFSAHIPLKNVHHAFFVQDQTTAIDSKLSAAKLDVYPNPTAGKATVDLPQSTFVDTYRIMDSKGRILLSSSPHKLLAKIELDLHQFSRGGYFIEIESEGKISSTQLVKW